MIILITQQKGFAEDKINMAQTMKNILGRARNIAGKIGRREYASYQ